MSKPKLKRCPCGEVPAFLGIHEGATMKYAYCSGDCCGEWNIEFRTGYNDVQSEKCMELAIDAWNDAGRYDDVL